MAIKAVSLTTASPLVIASLYLLCLAALPPSAAQESSNSSVITAATAGFRNSTFPVSAVSLNNDLCFSVCVYPTSGTYCFLNRLLYYSTLVFSLFSRAHLWLVAGALAASLTYSGAAAVHACLLVWRGPNPYIENDSWALYLVLTTACLIAVPLLNWSGTLRRLGASAASLKDKKGLKTQSGSGTRTLVIYWAFLVLIGYICVWVQFFYGELDSDREYPDMSQVVCQAGTNASMIRSSGGQYLRRVIDQDFINNNKCTNPCNVVDIPSIFRKHEQLQLLSRSQALLWDASTPNKKYQVAEKLQTANDQLLTLSLYLLPFILVQGFIAVCFGRRDPREVRDLIYINLYMERPFGKPILRRIQDWTARILAFLTYIIAAATVIVCPPLFILTIVGEEWSDWTQIPDSDGLTNVGQWGVWVVAGLAILAALIAKYHDTVVGGLATACSCIFGRCIPSRRRSGMEPSPQNLEAGTGPLPPSSDKHAKADGQHEKKPVDPSTAASLRTESDKTSDKNAAAALPSAAMESTARTTGRPRTITQRFLHQTWILYKKVIHPMSQNDQGLRSEISNFFHWCKEPQEVSRKVVRHPLRPHDPDAEEYILGPDGEPVPLEPKYRDRLNSGFFKGMHAQRHQQ